LNYYYITGTSRGIGKAFAEFLLEDPSNNVIGMSRHKTIEHPNYRHFFLDLTNVSAVTDFKFELHSHPQKIYLINNAGTLGAIRHIGKQSVESIVASYTVNLIAPSILTNAFIDCYNTTDAEKVILNISSGAGKNPIDGWATYCASKAGLDMFSRTVDLEQKLRAKHPQENIHKSFKIFSISPGVVNTQMQSEIREASEEDFSRLEDFKRYKETEQLADPKNISRKYFEILSDINSIKDVLSAVKDYN
jgi:benzil reductase ((S)-benzoin forming)